jgi:thiamine biosynthesis lipoprotein
MTREQVIRSIIGLALILLLGIGGMYRLQHQSIANPAHSGWTMGTGYSVQIPGKIPQKQLREIHEQINAELMSLNRQMSTWDSESEISRFNHSEATAPFSGSADFIAVVRRSLELSNSTAGAFDPALQPLLNLWGFGSEAEERQVPTVKEIEAARKLTGAGKVGIDKEGRLTKSDPAVSLALGAIAKGYGVDRLAAIMDTQQLENWFVEIGGEVAVRGHNPDGEPWRVGIQYPTTNPLSEELQGIMHVTGGAVATSGNYRNYIEEDGVIYSHILDPRTGRTVLSDTASVTVCAPDCMTADALATALFVMGAEEGLSWVEKQDGIEAMFLTRGEDGEIIEHFSSGFRKFTGYTSRH